VNIRSANDASTKHTAEEILALLAGGESERLACARERVPPEELAATFTALANSNGGVVLLGIGGRVHPRVDGLNNVSAAEECVLDATLAITPPLLLPLPQVVEVDSKPVLWVEVPAGLPHVYNIHGRYLHRDGPANVAMPAHQLRRLLLERAEAGWDRSTARQARFSDLDPDKIQRYVEQVGGAALDDPMGWLVRRGCLEQRPDEYGPTNAGLLLFARHVEQFHPQCELTLVRYRGVEMADEWEREDIRDTLPEQVRRARNWLMEHMRKGSRMAGLEREDWTEYPEAVVREILVNAVAHRDYSMRGESIRIALYANRLECYSPGRLPGHVTVENIQSERYSRNEVLVQALSDLRMIERLGYGIDRVLTQMSAAGLPAPTFRETPAGFLVTLQGRAEKEARELGIDTAEWLRQGLNDRQIGALLFLAERRRITNREYRDLQPDVSDETVRRDLADLVTRGLLLRIGDRRGTYYILR
jgi:ATP-dependent DNA helicase RecG